MADNYEHTGGVWVLLQTGELLRFGSSRQMWIGRDRSLWKIYTKNDAGREGLIAYIRKCKVVSIGFEKPDITKSDPTTTAGEVPAPESTGKDVE